LKELAKELQGSTESDPNKLGKLAVDRLYEEFPDLTIEELDAVSYAFNPDPTAQ